MIVLGIHCGHDSACALVKDGIIIADVQEERFSRIKHSSNVPGRALQYCLAAGNISSLHDVDIVAVASRYLRPELAAFLGVCDYSDSTSHPNVELHRVKPPTYLACSRSFAYTKLHLVEHHLAHASCAHFTRRSADKCLVFTMDGLGDGVSTAVWIAEGSRISAVQKLDRRASLGWAYSVLTEALGWWHGDGEGKTMGLAAYGDARRCIGVLDELFPLMERCSIKRPSSLGRPYRWNESNAIHWHFDESEAVKRLLARYEAADLAAEGQRKLEENVMEYVFGWTESLGITRTAFAGGVFLNVKLNQRIWNSRGNYITEQHVFPNAGDAGLAVGAALHAYYSVNAFAGYQLEHLLWGPDYSDSYIGQLLTSRHIPFKVVEDPSSCAAQLLAHGCVVGWFNGRMESGPRALGARSILASPYPASNKDRVNALVKFRESFRPLCPSILWEKRDDYVSDARDEPFMITSFDVHPCHENELQAVVHVDGTVRPQMVRRNANEAFWRLIAAFGQLTGVYAVLNTSMNLKGEPIVNTPNEAIRLFFDSGIDAMFLGHILIRKETLADTQKMERQ